MADALPLGTQEGVSRSVRGKHEARQLQAAYETLSDAEKTVLELKRRIAELENFVHTMIGANGVTVAGNVISGPNIPFVPPARNGTSVLPYEAGTTKLGSDDPRDPQPPPDDNLPRTDTGIINTQPLTIDSKETDGFSVRLITRAYQEDVGSGSFALKLFDRLFTFNNKGPFVQYSAEDEALSATISGDGEV